jgi:hypothetical protein
MRPPALRRVKMRAAAGAAGIAIALALFANGRLVIGASQRNHDLQELFYALQQSRFESFVSACEDTNREHRTLIKFVADVSPRLREPAQIAFPIESDCLRYARLRVRPR